MSAIYRLSRSLIRHRIVYLLVVRSGEVCLFLLAGLSAFLLRFEFTIPPERRIYLAYALAVWVPMQAVAYYSLGLWSGGWRFVSLHDALRLLVGKLRGYAGQHPRNPCNRSAEVSPIALHLGFCALLFVGCRSASRSSNGA